MNIIRKRLNKFVSGIIILLLIAVTGYRSTSYASSPKTDTKNLNQGKSDPQRLKARHYFLAAQIADVEHREAESYELLKKSLQADPSYEEALYYFGVARLNNDLDTMRSTAEIKRSIEMIGKLADSHPGDLQENLYYAYISGVVDPAESARIYARTAELEPQRTAILLQLAEAQIRARQLKEAYQTLQKYENIEGETPEVSTRKIQLLFNQADTAGARNEIDRLIALHPADTRYRLLRSSLAGAIGDTLLMEKDLIESDRLDPDNASVKLGLADLARSRGDSVKYDNYIYQALLLPGLELEDKRDLLGEYLQQLLTDKGDTSRGDALFEALSAQYPHQAELLELEARYRMAIGKTREAIELMEYAISLDPENETYWRQLMSYAMMAKDYKTVEKAFTDASESISPDTQTIMLYALACGLAGDTDKAIEAYASVAEPILGTKDLTLPLAEMKPLPKIDLYQADILKSVYSMASDVLWKAGRKEETFAVCDNALFLSPDDASTLNNYAYFLAESDRNLETAREMSERTIQEEPENPTYLDTFAWILFKAGDYQDALKYQKMAIAITIAALKSFNEDSNLDSDEFKKICKDLIDNIEAQKPAEGVEELYENYEGINQEFYDHLSQILKACGDNRGARKAADIAKELKEKEDEK